MSVFCQVTEYRNKNCNICPLCWYIQFCAERRVFERHNLLPLGRFTTRWRQCLAFQTDFYDTSWEVSNLCILAELTLNVLTCCMFDAVSLKSFEKNVTCLILYLRNDRTIGQKK